MRRARYRAAIQWSVKGNNAIMRARLMALFSMRI
jgi:hypothetical protein